MSGSDLRPDRPTAPLARALLLSIGFGSLAALAVALVAQHGFDIQPCPWCVIQRVAVIALAFVALTGAAASRAAPRAAPASAALLLVALSVGGAVAAWHQHTVASKQLSCAFTWADRTLMAWQLDALWPAMFRVGATCADAAKATMLGWPFEVWSGAWFALVGLAAAGVLVQLARAPRPRP
jgi:disulfide bond formation protein DsbB